MTDRKRPTGEDATAAIARALEGLAGQFGAALGEAMSRLGEGDGSAWHHSRVHDTGAGPVRAEIGLRVRSLGGQETRAPFRTRPAAPPAAAPPAATDADPAREVVLTGFPDRDGWTFAADLPGVGPDDVAVTVEGATLHLSTSGPRRYRGAAGLPPGLDTAAMTMTVRNGVLSVTFPAKGGPAA